MGVRIEPQPTARRYANPLLHRHVKPNETALPGAGYVGHVQALIAVLKPLNQQLMVLKLISPQFGFSALVTALNEVALRFAMCIKMAPSEVP